MVEEIRFDKGQLNLTLMPRALGIVGQAGWGWSIPRPVRKPFRETKLRLDSPVSPDVDQPLVNLIREARKVQELAMGSGLTLLQLEKREGRCRKQMSKLLRVSWLSPRLCEAIFDGRQPCHITRKLLLDADLPLDWSDQERLIGFAA